MSDRSYFARSFAPLPLRRPRCSSNGCAFGLILIVNTLIVGCGKSGTASATTPAAAGQPADGVKLSQYDKTIVSPSIAVALDGTIHVAFIEKQAASPYAPFVYHRQSADGGKTWSEPKNVSEDMANYDVNDCKLLVDGKDRVYVVWQTGLKEGWPANNSQHNLVFRACERGKWGKILPVHPPADQSTQSSGSIYYMATVDGAGHAQVIWNSCTTPFHPEMKLALDSGALIYESTLDGLAAVTPRQIFVSPVQVLDANNPLYSRYCDDLAALDGYVDKAGAMHLIARVAHPPHYEKSKLHLELIEDGKQSPAVDLPTLDSEENPPRVLLDAKGRRHVITLYLAGEHPSFRDYLLGSDEDPKVILAAKGPTGTCLGFQAFQGPGGRMGIVMQTTVAGLREQGDSWLSVSDGGDWSAPRCITNNATRATFTNTQNTPLHGVATGAIYGPGAGAIAFDRDGHVLLALINVKVGSMGQNVGGVAYSVGGTSDPMLFFYKF